MAVIYVVTRGEYSDYTILGVYSTEENARLMHDVDDLETNIEEYELNEFVAEKRKGRDCWIVTMRFDGTVTDASEFDSNSDSFNVRFAVWSQEVDLVATTTCFARSRTHAIKIANERLAKWKARHPEPWAEINARTTTLEAEE